MEHLPVFYTILFNAITDAIIALDHNDSHAAKCILLAAQLNAENAYLESADEGSPV